MLMYQKYLIFTLKKNMLDVKRTSVPEGQNLGYRDMKQWHHETLLWNDCLYRNINRYEFIAVFDIDEIPVPRKHNNLQDLLKSVGPHFTGYTFTPVFFSPTKDSYIVDNTLSAKKTSIIPGNAKSIWSTENTLVLHDQHMRVSCLKPETCKRRQLHSYEAHLHHYRKCKGGLVKGACWENNPVEDSCFKNITTKIVNRVDDVIGKVFRNDTFDIFGILGMFE